MNVRRKILFTIHHLHRLQLEPGFPREALPALHVCPDGLLFKDSFLSFDDVASIEAPEELELHDEKLAGSDCAVELAPGEGCLVLRPTGPRGRDVVFLVRDAAELAVKLLDVWARHRQDLPAGWRRVRDADFSMQCPVGWREEETRHPHLRLRLFSKDDGAMMNVLVYDGEGAPLETLAKGLAAKVGERPKAKVREQLDVRLGDRSGRRLVVEDATGEKTLVSDTILLACGPSVVEMQFLVPAERYAGARPTIDRVAAGFRWLRNGA